MARAETFAVIHIALVDETATYSSSELDQLAHVMHRYGLDVGAAWGTKVVVKHYQTPPQGAWLMRLLHLSDEQGALAYHEVADDGIPAGRVFLDTIEQSGTSVTVGLAHEIAEMIVDPWCILGAQYAPGRWVGYEICDPVEADEYGYNIDGVLVSDFVYPGWFYPGLSEQVDHTRALTKALSLAPGGYASIEVNGIWKQVTARLNDASGSSRSTTSHRINRRIQMVELAKLIDQDLHRW